MSHQLEHKEYTFESKKFQITVICDHLKSPANQGALFRICEAFGVRDIIFYGNIIDINSSRLRRTARSTEKITTYSCLNDVTDIFAIFQKRNTQVVGLEITNDSKPIQKLQLEKKDNLILIIGSEKHGISKELLAKMDAIYDIPMYGSNSSMNVIQSAGIALYEITNQLSI